MKKSKFFKNLPREIEIFKKFAEKIEIFQKFARKNQHVFVKLPENRNFSEICMEKSKFCLPGSTTPRFQTRLTPLFSSTLRLGLHNTSSKISQCIQNFLAEIHLI